MKIFSIVRITKPTAIVSWDYGRIEVNHSDDELTADRLCSQYNDCRGCQADHYHYEVESIDEMSPERAPATASY